MTRQQSIGAYVFAAAMIAAGILAVVVSVLRLENANYLIGHGVHVQGTVMSAQVHGDEEGNNNSVGSHGSSYSLDVEYSTGKSNGYRSFDITEEGYRNHVTGSQVEVIYDPSDPDKALLVGGLNAPTSSFPIWLGLIFASAGIAFTLYTHHYNHRPRGVAVEDYGDSPSV